MTRVTDRIRQIARDKVRVRITLRVRSSSGFVVTVPVVAAGGGVLREERTFARSKREAEQVLLAKIRCWQELIFQIEPNGEGK